MRSGRRKLPASAGFLSGRVAGRQGSESSGVSRLRSSGLDAGVLRVGRPAWLGAAAAEVAVSSCPACMGGDYRFGQDRRNRGPP